MNRRSFIPLLSALFCLVAIVGAPAASPLESSMKQMGKAYKQLSLDLQKPQDAGKNDYLALAATLKTQAQTSRSLVPNKAEGLPADQQAAMVQDYQKSIDGLIATIDSLTQDIQAGKWDDARKAMADLKQEMADGHKAFRKKEK